MFYFGMISQIHVVKICESACVRVRDAPERRVADDKDRQIGKRKRD
jgi:hypothetical protein